LSLLSKPSREDVVDDLEVLQLVKNTQRSPRSFGAHSRFDKFCRCHATPRVFRLFALSHLFTSATSSSHLITQAHTSCSCATVSDNTSSQNMSNAPPPQPPGPEKPSGMSLFGFTMKKRAAPLLAVAVQPEEKEPAVEFISAIEDNKITRYDETQAMLSSRLTFRSVNPIKPKGPLVIPLIEPQITRVYVPKKAAALPPPGAPGSAVDMEDRFTSKMDDGEAGVPDKVEVKVEGMKYGLQVKKGKQEPASDAPQQPLTFAAGDVPLVMRNRPAELYAADPRSSLFASNSNSIARLTRPCSDDVEDEDERFRLDVHRRPDEATLEAYEDVPVEQFGEALLRGMGWEPGKGLGPNEDGLAVPIEYVKRPHRLGLGAQPKPGMLSAYERCNDTRLPPALSVEVKKKKFIKPGETRDAKPAMMVVAKDANGHQRSFRTLDEQLVPYVPC
jgi:hypothetical protein